MSKAVEIIDLKKSYKKFQLDTVSMELPQGYILGLIGPNGAGKTTTLKIMMDMVRADSGRIRIFDLDHRKHSKEIKHRVGYVGEEPYFYGDKTVSWTGKWISEFYGSWDLNHFEKLLLDFGISRTKKTGQLSKGMKVKLSLALALSHRPELLILDEPTAGLDPQVFGSSGITDDFLTLKGRLIQELDRQTIKVENLNLDDILIACVKGDGA
jgi:ABC-2 type transport system ATP-binding protein